MSFLLFAACICFGQQNSGGLPAAQKGRRVFDPEAFQILQDFHHNKIVHQQKGLTGMAECHFTVANCADPQDYALCEKLGLAVVVSQAPHLEGKDWIKMSDEAIDQYVRDLVRKGGKSRSIIGYHICDEPSSTAFPALAKAVAAVKKYAPGKFAFINLYPNYATLWTMDQVKSQLGTKTYTEYLEKFVNEVKPQLISYDNYMVQFSMDLAKTDQAAKYYTNLVEVRRIAEKYRLPFYNIVSSNQIRPHTTIPSPANLAFQAYTTLAAGARGVKWYTYHYGGYGYAPLDKNEDRTLTWRYLEEVNREIGILGPLLSQMTSTGVYFTSPAPDPSLPVLPGNWTEKATSDAPLMVGEFKSADGTNYLMVVNLSLEKSARFDIQTKIPNEELYIVTVGEESHPLERVSRKNGVWLTAGQGVLLKCGGRPSEDLPDEKVKY
ncbi:MAG TPA: hypothetical protein VHE54_17900 [Puia sp.]|nr:hypothetical protein [Puia sp.]